MQDVATLLRQAAASRSSDAMLRAGAAALQSKQYAPAIEPVRAAVERDPDNPRLSHLLGLLYRNLENLDLSVEAFGRAAALAPGDPAIAHAHAAVRHEAGLPAVEAFEKAMRLSPPDQAMLLHYAAALSAEGKNEEAISLLDEEVRRNPHWLRGHGVLARRRWESGDQANFTASYERALAALPRDVALWRAYVETLLGAELYERALPVIQQGRSAAGHHHTFDAAEAIALGELGQAEAAEPLFARVAHIHDGSIAVHRLRLLLRGGRFDEAAGVGEGYLSSDLALQVLPYLSLAWRLTGNPNWEWLEGDPSFIGVYDIADRLPPLDALADRLRALHRSVRQPFDQSLRGGTQTQDHLLPRIEPEIRALRMAIVQTVEEHVDRLPPPQPGHPLLIERRRPISFTGSWSVRLSDGGRHINHVHPAGWISSALYVSLPEEIKQTSDHAGWLALGEATELGLDLPPIRMVEPRPGRLVLFPSTMWHGTRPFKAGERLTVAFDVKRPS